MYYVTWMSKLIILVSTMSLLKNFDCGFCLTQKTTKIHIFLKVTQNQDPLERNFFFNIFDLPIALAILAYLIFGCGIFTFPEKLT